MGRLIGTRKCDLYRAEYAVGKTYREIAAEYGVSYQAVQQAVTRKKAGVHTRCIWSGLSDWMEENNVRVVDIAKTLGVGWGTVYGWLTGKNEPRKSNIDALLKLTGWAYEDLFREE